MLLALAKVLGALEIDLFGVTAVLVAAGTSWTHFIADPLLSLLATVTHIAVVGGVQPLPRRRPFLRRETTPVAVGHAVLLRPGLREHLDCW
jgi:hypothetical protein